MSAHYETVVLLTMPMKSLKLLSSFLENPDENYPH